ncbi:MAG: aminoacyl-tRNA deacylase [Candidatus Nanohaloarchaea archaeon]
MEAFEQSREQLEEFLGFMEEDIENVRRVIEFCDREDIDADFIIHGKAETVEQSSEVKDIEESRIVKTLVFRCGEEFVAVLCPGDERVDEEKLEEVTGKEVRMANPEEVEEATGYVIGGVSPFDLDIQVLMEEKLLERDRVNPAAGSRVVGAEVDPEELIKRLKAEKVEVVGK